MRFWPDLDVEKLGADMNLVVNELYEFNAVLCEAFVTFLQCHGVGNCDTFADALDALSPRYDETGSRVGAMLKNTAARVRNPAAPTRPRFDVIPGGKKEP